MNLAKRIEKLEAKVAVRGRLTPAQVKAAIAYAFSIPLPLTGPAVTADLPDPEHLLDDIMEESL
jgi:hypothetical protein